jgi:tetratricopeptide (TPR) repeat protein
MKQQAQRGAGNVELVTAVCALAAGLAIGWGVAHVDAEPTANEVSAETAASNAANDGAARRDELAEDALGGGPSAAAEANRRREVDAADATTAPAVDVAALAAANPLVGELTALLADPALLALVGASEEATADFLMHLYLGLGDLDAALSLAQRTDPTAGGWSQLAQALDGAGRAKDAANAYAAALEAAGRFAWEEPLASWATRLAELDPARGLALLEERSGESGAGDPSAMRLALARSLARTGRTDEAREALLALVAENREVSSSLAALAEFDATLAESELRRVLGAGGHAELHVQLVELLTSQGRSTDALAALDVALAQPSEQSYALIAAALSNMSELVDDTRLAAWIASNDNQSGLFQQVGEHFANAGNVERALPWLQDGWEEQLAKDGYLFQLPEALLTQNPTLVRGMVDAAATKAGDRDEIWGDIADHYWRLGDAAAAENAYRRANQLDPGDGEWTGKLTALAEGKPPF